MSKRGSEREPLEGFLLSALRALDRQVAREMQRTPADREQHGVQKWEPFAKRIEKVCGYVLDGFEDGQCQLDSLIIMSQAMAKILRIVIEDLGGEGLGQMRASYCTAALEAIERDSRHGLSALRGGESNQMM